MSHFLKQTADGAYMLELAEDDHTETHNQDSSDEDESTVVALHIIADGNDDPSSTFDRVVDFISSKVKDPLSISDSDRLQIMVFAAVVPWFIPRYRANVVSGLVAFRLMRSIVWQRAYMETPQQQTALLTRVKGGRWTAFDDANFDKNDIWISPHGVKHRTSSSMGPVRFLSYVENETNPGAFVGALQTQVRQLKSFFQADESNLNMGAEEFCIAIVPRDEYEDLLKTTLLDIEARQKTFHEKALDTVQNAFDEVVDTFGWDRSGIYQIVTNLDRPVLSLEQVGYCVERIEPVHWRTLRWYVRDARKVCGPKKFHDIFFYVHSDKEDAIENIEERVRDYSRSGAGIDPSFIEDDSTSLDISAILEDIGITGYVYNVARVLTMAYYDRRRASVEKEHPDEDPVSSGVLEEAVESTISPLIAAAAQVESAETSEALYVIRAMRENVLVDSEAHVKKAYHLQLRKLIGARCQDPDDKALSRLLHTVHDVKWTTCRDRIGDGQKRVLHLLYVALHANNSTGVVATSTDAAIAESPTIESKKRTFDDI
jgi:hypothetical protein